MDDGIEVNGHFGQKVQEGGLGRQTLPVVFDGWLGDLLQVEDIG
jgi:hypothetical protein